MVYGPSMRSDLRIETRSAPMSDSSHCLWLSPTLSFAWLFCETNHRAILVLQQAVPHAPLTPRKSGTGSRGSRASPATNHLRAVHGAPQPGRGEERPPPRGVG